MSQMSRNVLSFLVAVCCVGVIYCAAQSDSSKMDKRGGARPFYGYYDMPGAKRINGESPYYFYDKRGGGRAFMGSWSPYSGRMERRGGGRAFAGSWQPNYVNSFYDSPYFNKRSSNLWEYLEGKNDVYRK